MVDASVSGSSNVADGLKTIPNAVAAAFIYRSLRRFDSEKGSEETSVYSYF